MVTLHRAPSGRFAPQSGHRPAERFVRWLNHNEDLIAWAKIRAQLAARAPLGSAEDWPEKP